VHRGFAKVFLWPRRRSWFLSINNLSLLMHITPNIGVVIRVFRRLNHVRRAFCLQVPAPGSTCLFIWSSELCIPVASSTGRSRLRSAVKECLVISYCRTKNYGQRSFSYSGSTLWNSMPLTLRDKSMSLSKFCSRLKLRCTAEPTIDHSAIVTA